MKLKFSWDSSPAGAIAICTSDASASNGMSPLNCLLMDDGGLDNSASISWLREGLKRVDAVLSDDRTWTGWDREDWGAALMKSETKVYSLHDSQCTENLPTAKCRRALAEWTAFVEAGSDKRAVIVDLADKGG